MPDDPGPPRSTTRAFPFVDILDITADPRSLGDTHGLGDSGSAGLQAVPGAVAGSAGAAQATAHHSQTPTTELGFVRSSFGPFVCSMLACVSVVAVIADRPAAWHTRGTQPGTIRALLGPRESEKGAPISELG